MQIWLASAVATSSSSSTLHPEALLGFRICIIRYNLSGVVKQAWLATTASNSRHFDFYFSLIEARRYEDAGCANRIHCR